MLDRAMVRLHFPNQLRQILLTAFQNRTNQVITEHGLTEPYTLNNGVDQGEVFSPLMWCIVKNVQWYHLYVSRGLIKPIKSAFINKSNTKFSCPISLIKSVTKTNIKILINDIYT